jgi:carbon starvation protein CstA
MTIFIIGLALLIVGYLFYGRLTEQTVRPDPSRPTPAFSRADGMDYVAMPTWRVYLVQLLNIAGLGPVFGPIMGALWGPQVFLWVVFGCILGGAVHDFLSGAMSVRNNGAGLPELIGRYLGGAARQLATLFILILMILVGTVFVKGPALLIVQLLPGETVGSWFGAGAADFLGGTVLGQSAWLWVIMGAVFAYYLAATLLPIHVIIGRVYPLFALALLVMVAGLAVSILTGSLATPTFTLSNLHPSGIAAWPVIFITVSCGAVSGFHATQSPLMARCLRNEKYMRPVFYGAMIAEGFIALVWASAAQGYYGDHGQLASVVASGGPGQVVHDICINTMGIAGGALAIIGVIVLPITSGDTAFRVARLIIADYLNITQSRAWNRYKIALPLFALAIALNFVDFTIVWRYFGWANQTLAAVALWTGAVFLARRRSRWWMAAFPATFMTAVTVTYILTEQYGLNLPLGQGVVLGLAAGLVSLAVFLAALRRLPLDDETRKPSDEELQPAARTTAPPA